MRLNSAAKIETAAMVNAMTVRILLVFYFKESMRAIVESFDFNFHDDDEKKSARKKCQKVFLIFFSFSITVCCARAVVINAFVALE